MSLLTGNRGVRAASGLGQVFDPAWAWFTNHLNFHTCFYEDMPDADTTGPLDGYSLVQGQFNLPSGDTARGSWKQNEDGPGVMLVNADVASGSSSNIAWTLPNDFYGLYKANNPDTRSPHITVCFTFKATLWDGRSSAQTLIELKTAFGLFYRINLSTNLNQIVLARPDGETYTYALTADAVTAMQARLVPIVVVFQDGGGTALWVDSILQGFGGAVASNDNLAQVRLGRSDLKEESGPHGEYGQVVLWNGPLTMGHNEALWWSSDPYGWTRPLAIGKKILRPFGPFANPILARIPGAETVDAVVAA